MGEESEPQIPSPDGDVVADFLRSLEPAATVVTTNLDFRLDFNCQKGNHYARIRRGSGIGRRKDSGTGGQETYSYMGIAHVVAQKFGGYYASRWQEYQSNHACHYQ